jgi:hypothetical protein
MCRFLACFLSMSSSSFQGPFEFCNFCFKRVAANNVIVHHLDRELELQIFDTVGAVVVAQGEVGAGAFLLLDGSVDVVKHETETGTDENQPPVSKTIGKIVASDVHSSVIFGELSLMYGNTRLASISVSSENTRLYRIQGEMFSRYVTHSHCL